MKKVYALGFIVVLCLVWAGEGHALDLNTFGDVTYGDSSKDGEPGGFSLGQLDFWATQELDAEGRFKAFFELGVESSGSGFVIDLERIWVKYDTRSSLRIRGGQNAHRTRLLEPDSPSRFSHANHRRTPLVS